MTDPYESLEVKKTATQDEIKKSYRRLAKKYHPDFNPGNKEAEKKFKNIQHAFDLIGTPDARSKWDRGETDEQKQQQYEEFARSQQKRERPFYYNTQDQGGRYSYSFEEDLGNEDLFESLFGSRKGRRGGAQFPGEDEVYHMEVDFKDAALGGEKVITLPNGKTLQVKIPAGIEQGKKLKFRGLGSSGVNGGPPGDAYVEISIRPHPLFKRNGKDLEIEMAVSYFEALLGGEIRVPTLEGNVLLKIPSGVSTGSKLRVKGKGAGPHGSRGNLMVVLKVAMPKEVPAEVKASIRELKEKYDYNPRGLNERENEYR